MFKYPFDSIKTDVQFILNSKLYVKKDSVGAEDFINKEYQLIPLETEVYVKSKDEVDIKKIRKVYKCCEFKDVLVNEKIRYTTPMLRDNIATKTEDGKFAYRDENGTLHRLDFGQNVLVIIEDD